MGRIGASFRSFRDRIRAAVSAKTQNYLFFVALTLVVVMAVMIRCTSILRPPLLIKEFDCWIQYYNAKYISEHSLYEYFNWHDYKSWYPGGIQRNSLRPGLPFTAVIFYIILNFIGIPVSLYDVCFYFPAFMGGLTVLAAYFLGKEVYDRNCGLFFAFFLAFNPGHMQRTMAGFFDNETVGVFGVLMTFLFFLKAVRTGSFSHSVIGGMFLGYLSLSWGGFDYVYFIIPLVCGILVLIKKYNENVLIAYAGVQGTGLMVFALYATYTHESLFKEVDTGGIFLFTFILIIFHFIYLKRNEYPNFYRKLQSTIILVLIPSILIIGVLIWVNPDILPLGIGGRLNSVLSPLLRDKMHLVASVAEHMPSAWSVFYYNTVIPLMLLPLGIYFCFKRLNAADIFMISFVLTLFYFTGSMVRIILLFAPAASLLGAYGLVNVLKIYGSFIGQKKDIISRKRRRQIKRPVGKSEVIAVYFLVGFLCIAQVTQSTDISINQLSYTQLVAGAQFHDWEETLMWMKNNLPGTAVVVSWWDYGYWITPIGNATTVNDNGTYNSVTIGMTGMALMQTNEIYAAEMFKRLKADYVLVYFGFLINGLGGDEGKWPWMLRICNDHYNIYKELGYEKDNWKADSVFDEDEYINATSQNYEDKWFDSQLVRLMFYGESTNPATVNPNTDYLEWYYASQIAGNTGQGVSQRKDDNGNTWKSHIPDNGMYDFKVFKPAGQGGYFSKTGMVKLFKMDYTALESNFEIKNAEVTDRGYANFNVKNTGTKDLLIEGVKVNDQVFNFTMSKFQSDNILEKGKEDTLWLDTSSYPYNLMDVVNVTVSAKAEALEGTTYTFTNSTKNFFVTQGEEGKVRINRENCKVVKNDQNNFDIYLEVENIGNPVVNIDRFYVAQDAGGYRYLKNTTIYTQGSSLLNPGEKCNVKLASSPLPFDPIGTLANLIGVATTNNETDEVLLSANLQNYKLSLLSENRIVSPEIAVAFNTPYKTEIPVDFLNTYIYKYDNGSNLVNIKVKNTGDTVLGLDSVYLTKTTELNTYYTTEDGVSLRFETIDDNYILNPGQENTIIADASKINLNINDHIAISVRAIGFDGRISASDIGLTYVARDKPDIQVIEKIENITTSFVTANESSYLVVKNTGTTPITLQNIHFNETTVVSVDSNKVEFTTGKAELNPQEVAVLSVQIPDLKINASNQVNVNITTTGSAKISKTFKAIVNPISTQPYFGIDINDAGTIAKFNDKLTIKIYSTGYFNTTLDSIYVNNSYVSLSQFSFVQGSSYLIGSVGGSITISVSMSTIQTILMVGTIPIGDKLKILARTKEGAEDIHLETVIS